MENKAPIANQNETFMVSFKLDTYDGPLDLLLELIKDKKMDILTLDIAELTYQYLEFVNNNLNKLPIDDIADYLVMASYLVELKSKTILPYLSNAEEVATDLEIDRLRRQLFLYKQYKDVINEFRMKQHKRVEYLSKRCDDLDEYIPEETPEAPLPDSIPIEKLVRAWQRIVLENQLNQVDKSFIINVSNINVDEIEQQIRSFIVDQEIKELGFNELLNLLHGDWTNTEYVCAFFFALLSLAKDRIINILQQAENGPIVISKNTDDVVETEIESITEVIKQHQALSDSLAEQLKVKTKITREDYKLFKDKDNKEN